MHLPSSSRSDPSSVGRLRRPVRHRAGLRAARRGNHRSSTSPRSPGLPGGRASEPLCDDGGRNAANGRHRRRSRAVPAFGPVAARARRLTSSSARPSTPLGALAAVERLRPAIVLLDVALPGLERLRRGRAARRRRTRSVVLVSSRDSGRPRPARRRHAAPLASSRRTSSRASDSRRAPSAAARMWATLQTRRAARGASAGSCSASSPTASSATTCHQTVVTVRCRPSRSPGRAIVSGLIAWSRRPAQPARAAHDRGRARRPLRHGSTADDAAGLHDRLRARTAQRRALRARRARLPVGQGDRSARADARARRATSRRSPLPARDAARLRRQRVALRPARTRRASCSSGTSDDLARDIEQAFVVVVYGILATCFVALVVRTSRSCDVARAPDATRRSCSAAVLAALRADLGVRVHVRQARRRQSSTASLVAGRRADPAFPIALLVGMLSSRLAHAHMSATSWSSST